jgi:isopenicillin-N N-acyltransferase like protein
MAKPEAGSGAPLPVLVVRGSHADLGWAMGNRQREQIARVVARAQEGFRERGTSEAEVREQNAPYVAAAARIYPDYLTELEAMAEGAGVPFDVLFRLNCYEAYPPGTRPSRRRETERETERVPTKDPAELAVANDPAAVAATPADGCTSVASKGAGGVVVGHTEDSSPEAIGGIYFLDARLDASPVAPVAPGEQSHRILALNYAQTLPGCAAAVNEAGLIVLIDALPDPDRRVGAPRHMVSRALLDLPSIEAAVEHLQQTERGGGWNYLLVQGERIVNVEATATRLVVHEAGPSGAYAHANHYLDPVLAADTGDPRPNSINRLSRALELVTPGMNEAQMKALLGDKQHFPDSICRERTVAALVADTAARQVQVCWGEPDGATWTAYPY